MISVAREPAAARLRQDHRRPPARAAASGRLIARIRDAFSTWRQRAQGRTQLAHLSERELRDIGLTPADAAREYAKPFWRG